MPSRIKLTMSFYYTYILHSEKDDNNYVGYTKDLKERIKEHNNGKVESTKGRRPLTLIYYEACLSEQDAKQREKYFKTTEGRRWLGKRLKHFNAEQSI